jgi:hypothetical protein
MGHHMRHLESRCGLHADNQMSEKAMSWPVIANNEFYDFVRQKLHPKRKGRKSMPTGASVASYFSIRKKTRMAASSNL